MTILEHWQIEKEHLRPLLSDQPDLAGVIYQVRHAILQTEQNALAEMTDDVLRQQAGVLMSCVKNSVGLLGTAVASEAWTLQKQEKRPFTSSKPLWHAAAGALLLLALLCVLQSMWLGLALCGVIASLGVCALLRERRDSDLQPFQEEVRITLTPDADQLFSILDGQMRAVDRYLNDFTYLNDQLRGGTECGDAAVAARAADLLEALYECDEEERAAADEAAHRLLESLGLRAVDYSSESSRLFNALPSKSITRTLSPAIVTLKEQRLLKRGTAAVRIGAA